MDWNDILKSSAEIVIAVGTIALAIATFQLARHTKAMNARDFERRRVEEARRCIQLAQAIVAMRGSDISRDALPTFQDLLALSGRIHDADTRRQYAHVATLFLTTVNENPGLTNYNASLADPIGRIRPRLTQEIVEWQKDLGNIT